MSLGVATGQKELEEEDARPPGPCLAVIPPTPDRSPSSRDAHDGHACGSSPRRQGRAAEAGGDAPSSQMQRDLSTLFTVEGTRPRRASDWQSRPGGRAALGGVGVSMVGPLLCPRGFRDEALSSVMGDCGVKPGARGLRRVRCPGARRREPRVQHTISRGQLTGEETGDRQCPLSKRGQLSTCP